MPELSLPLSAAALLVSLVALWRSGRRQPSGPTPNVLSSLSVQGDRSEPYPPRSPGLPVGSHLSAEISPEVAELVAAGNKIAAIKQYRIETGAGLKEAKDAVEAFERGGR